MNRPRYEFKYVLPHAVAERVRARLEDAMEPDPHSAAGGYRVDSIYFDSPDFDSYFAKIDGVSYRTKVRLRFYGERMDPAYLEAKVRQDVLIRKVRVRLPAEVAEAAAEGRMEPEAFVGEAGEFLSSLFRLRPLLPVCLVGYHRQAFVCRLDPTLRVTFDRNLRVQGPEAANRTHSLNGAPFFPPDLCVMEIKFHWAIPIWLAEICREAALLLRRYSKYCSAIEHRFPHLAVRSVSHR